MGKIKKKHERDVHPPTSQSVNICILHTSSALSVVNKTRRRCRTLGCTSNSSLTTLCVCITATHTCHPSCLPGWIVLVTGPSGVSVSTTRSFESTQSGNGPGCCPKMSVSHACTERTRVSVSVSFKSALLVFGRLCPSSDENRRQDVTEDILLKIVAFCDVNEVTECDDDWY